MLSARGSALGSRHVPWSVERQVPLAVCQGAPPEASKRRPAREQTQHVASMCSGPKFSISVQAIFRVLSPLVCERSGQCYRPDFRLS